MSEELLKIKDLTISFSTDKGLHTVVDHLNMEVRKGQIVGIVGESGSGKTMTSLAVMGLLDKAAVVDPCSSITLKGKEILNISREERRKIQGNQISMVFQEPMTSLNPVMKVGRQIGEVLRLHTDLDDEEIDRRVADILTQIGLYDVRELMEKYPDIADSAYHKTGLVFDPYFSGTKLRWILARTRDPKEVHRLFYIPVRHDIIEA